MKIMFWKKKKIGKIELKTLTVNLEPVEIWKRDVMRMMDMTFDKFTDDIDDIISIYSLL